ncbi:MAG: phenylacetate--CoA ligase, partial [Spirochaetales bacterium]|nr:phenylacetate--CoA ligase [Spirochaetales bacterium]
MIWNPEAEQAKQEVREKQQLADLQKLAKKVYEKVPFYKQRFDELKVKPEDIRALDDIKYLPFTTKTDLRDIYPYGLLAVPLKDIVEIHTSSGTTGIPVVDAYTKKDLDVWAEGMARTLTMAGAGPEDVLQNGYGYGLFT